MNDRANTNQHSGAPDTVSSGQAPQMEQPFAAPSPMMPNTPKINPANLPYNQYVGGGPAMGSVQPIPPQAQNGRWVPIDAPQTGLPSGVIPGQPIQGPDGLIYCYGAGATEYNPLSSNGVRPIATPSDIIQLPPIVQPIAMVPYTTMNQPLLQYNPNNTQQYSMPGMPNQFSYQHFNGAGQNSANETPNQTEESSFDLNSSTAPSQRGYNASYAQPTSTEQYVRPLPMLKKTYRGLTFTLMLFALATLIVTMVLPYASWINIKDGAGYIAMPTFGLIEGIFNNASPFYSIASSQVGYYAYGLVVSAVLASVMLLAVFIKNLIFFIKGKNPKCVSVFSIIAVLASIVSGVMIYLIASGIDPTYAANYEFLNVFGTGSSNILWGFNPLICIFVSLLLFILPLFAKKDAFLTPPPALGIQKGSNNIIRSY